MDDTHQAHLRICGLAGQLAQRLGDAPPADTGELCRLRWTFSREVMLYLAKAGRTPGAIPDANDGQLRTLVTEQLKRWTIDRIAAEWQIYRNTTLRLLHLWDTRSERHDPMPGPPRPAPPPASYRCMF